MVDLGPQGVITITALRSVALQSDGLSGPEAKQFIRDVPRAEELPRSPGPLAAATGTPSPALFVRTPVTALP